MRLGGRRESTNVEDRRGRGAKGATIGIGGIVVAALAAWLLGGDPMQVVTSGLTQQMTSGGGGNTEYVETAEDKELASFTKKILAGTEDVWAAEFKKMGKTYTPPQLVLFSGATSSGCGNANSQTGPFYCSADQCVYIDLSFFKDMKRQLDADGDFAYAYVVAHEVGHHVQNLLGTLGQVQQQQSRMSEKEANRLNVRLELQADFYAGVWAYHDNQMFNSIEDGDVEEGMNAANKIGDDRLQMQAQGYTVPDAFNHGTSAQRMKWLKRGLNTGDINQGNTFSGSYESL